MDAPSTSDRIVLAYFGRLAANKGLGRMLNCFRKSDAYKSCELRVYGDGPERHQLHKIKAEVDDCDRIKLCGEYGDGKEFLSCLADIHGVVLLSTNGEGIPLVLLEAMSVGIPFLATGICGIPDAAAGNPDCLLTRSDDESIASAMGHFAANIRSETYNRQRLRKYFNANFHTSVSELAWRGMLTNPTQFFRPVHS